MTTAAMSGKSAGSLTLDRLAPEFRLLCLAISRPGDFAAAADTIAADWQALVDGAQRHRVAPLVLNAVRDRHGPAEPLAVLRRKVMTSSKRCLAWLAESDRLVRTLDEAGIRVLVLKGCALSLQLYGDPSRRQCGDIDLLIEPGQLWEADEIILKLGFRREVGQIAESTRAMHKNWIKDLSYRSDRWHVELHHRLTDNPLLLPYDFEQLWAEREIVSCGGLNLPVPSRRFAALYLTIHGADHGWERLGWLADIAVLLRDGQAQAAALDDAEALGLAATMVESLHLAHDWLGLTLHDSRLVIDKRAARRLRRFVSGYSPGSGRGLKARWGRDEWRYGMVLRRHLIRYRLRGTARYRLRQVLTDIASPQDWVAFPLPRALTWLYPLLRPVGWIVRHAGSKAPR